jgi:hypothetical protein
MTALRFVYHRWRIRSSHSASHMSERAYSLFRVACAAYALVWLASLVLTNVCLQGTARVAIDLALVLIMPSVDMFQPYDRYVAWSGGQHDHCDEGSDTGPR